MICAEMEVMRVGTKNLVDFMRNIHQGGDK